MSSARQPEFSPEQQLMSVVHNLADATMGQRRPALRGVQAPRGIAFQRGMPSGSPFFMAGRPSSFFMRPPQPSLRFQPMPAMRMREMPMVKMPFNAAPVHVPEMRQSAYSQGPPPELRKLFEDAMGTVPHIASRHAPTRSTLDVDQLSDDLVKSAQMRVNPTKGGLSVEFDIPEGALENLRQQFRDGISGLRPAPPSSLFVHPPQEQPLMRMIGMRPRANHNPNEEKENESRAAMKATQSAFQGLMSGLNSALGEVDTEDKEEGDDDEDPLAKVLGDVSHLAESFLGGAQVDDPPTTLPGSHSQLEDLLSGISMAPEDGALGPWMRNQTTKAMYLEIPVLGMDPKAMQVQVRDNRLIVTAEQDESVTRKHGAEESSSVQDLHEEFALPYPVHESVRAFVKGGKLVIQLPPPVGLKHDNDSDAEIEGEESAKEEAKEPLHTGEELESEESSEQHDPEDEQHDTEDAQHDSEDEQHDTEDAQHDSEEQESEVVPEMEGDDDDTEASKDAGNDDSVVQPTTDQSTTSNDGDDSSNDSSSSTHYYASDTLPVR